MWCADPHTLAKHMVESSTNCGRLGKPKTGGPGLLDTSELRDLSLIEAAKPLSTKEKCRAVGRNGCAQNYKPHKQIELEGWTWNDKKRRTPVYVDEMVDEAGNIWGPDDWPDLVHQHFVDLCKAPRPRSWLRSVSFGECPMQPSTAERMHGLCKHALRWKCRWNLQKEKANQNEEYEEQLMAYVNGSYFLCPGCKDEYAVQAGRGRKR